MTKFIIKGTAFILIPVVLLFLMELYLKSYPLTFHIQSRYFKNNLENIELLITGSSHNHDAINPELLLSINSATLARGGQDIKLNHLMLEKFIGQMPNLKFVILELSYHSLEHHIPKTFHVNTLFLRYYNINNFGRQTTILDKSIFFSAPKIYGKLFNPFRNRPLINKYGIVMDSLAFATNIRRFNSLNYNMKLIEDTKDNYFIKRHKYRDLFAYSKNKSYFNKILLLCRKKNVLPIILIPPVHNIYREEMVSEKKRLRDDFLDSLVTTKDKILVWNYEASKKFKTTDFKNDDHLNIKGAIKFTNMINDSIFKLISKN